MRYASGEQNEVPSGVLPSVSDLNIFKFPLPSAESLSRCGISLKLQECHDFEIFVKLSGNWVTSYAKSHLPVRKEETVIMELILSCNLAF